MPPRGSAKKQAPKTTPQTKGTRKTAPKTIVKSRTPNSETAPKAKATPQSAKRLRETGRKIADETPVAEAQHSAASSLQEPETKPECSINDTSISESECRMETAMPGTQIDSMEAEPGSKPAVQGVGAVNQMEEEASKSSTAASEPMVVETEKASEVGLACQEAESAKKTSGPKDVESMEPAEETAKTTTITTKKKKKIIRKVITVVRKKVPVSQKKASAEENPSAIPTNSINPSLDPDDQVKAIVEKDPKDTKKPTEPSEKPAEARNSGEKPLSGEEMGVDVWADEFEIAERRKKRRTEIFVGGLDKEAKEDDIRMVFEKAGELVEVRLMKNRQTGKNKGYAFLRYATHEDAQRAIKELAHAEVCGKQCAASPVEDRDTIFLGNIDKKWKKEDLMRVLHETGIENVYTVYLMMDHNNPGCNRGFAFVELETNKDAHNAFKKLQKDAFGKGRNITVAWAEPLSDPSEEEMQKVKTVYANGVSTYWDEEKVKKHFSKFGEIEKIKLAKDMHNPKRKDFAFVDYVTREAALACIESFNKEELVDEGSKVNIKVMLAKPLKKSTQSKAKPKTTSDVQAKQTKKEPHEGPIQSAVPVKKGYFVNRGTSGSIRSSSTAEGGNSSAIHDMNSYTKLELIKVLREQASWRQGASDFGTASTPGDYLHGLAGGKRPISALGEDLYSDPRGYPRACLDNSFPYTSTSYGTHSYGGSGTSLPSYHQHSAGYTAGSYPPSIDSSATGRMRYGGGLYGTGPSLRY